MHGPINIRLKVVPLTALKAQREAEVQVHQTSAVGGSLPTALEAKIGRIAGLDAFVEESILRPKEITPPFFHPVT
jgi:hypothetical protein